MAHLTQRRSGGPVPPAEHRGETIIAPAGKLGLVIGLEDDDKPPAIVKIIRKDSPLVDRMFFDAPTPPLCLRESPAGAQFRDLGNWLLLCWT